VAGLFIGSSERTRSSATIEIPSIDGHYAVQGHSRWLILIQIKNPCLLKSQGFLYSASYRETWPATLYTHRKWQLIGKS